MKRIAILLIALFCSLPFYGQNSRNRTVSTIVQDVLAQMPADNKEDFDREIVDLVKNADLAMVEMAGMFQPDGASINSKLEYAVNGAVNYATEHSADGYLDKLREGFGNVLKGDYSVKVKRLFIYQYRFFSCEKDIPVLTGFLADKELSSIAMQTLVATPGAYQAVLEMFRKGETDLLFLAPAAGTLHITEAEPYLLEGYAEASGQERPIYSAALAQCGTKASLKLMAKGDESDYIALLGRLSSNGESALATKKAKSLLKSDDSGIRSAALDLIVDNEGLESWKYVFAAIKSNDRKCRCSALESALKVEGMDRLIIDSFGKISGQSRIDVINWIGDRRLSLATELLADVAVNDDALASDAIMALGKVDDANASSVLAGLIQSPRCDMAAEALAYCSADISSELEKIISGSTSSEYRSAAMRVASKRGFSKVSDSVFGLLDSENESLRTSAYNALQGVVSASDFRRIAELENSGVTGYDKQIGAALLSASRQNFSENALDEVISMMEKSARPYLYYSSLAQHQSEKAVEKLAEEYYRNNHASLALSELMHITDPSVMDVLKTIGLEEQSDKILERYIQLVDISAIPLDSKYFRLDEILKKDMSDFVNNRVIAAMGNLTDINSFRTVASFLEDPDIAYEAALSIKKMSSAIHQEIDYSELKPVLERACEIFSEGKGTDDSYYIAEIRKLLSEIKTEPKFELSEEEKEMGFEVLFDGTDLDKWIGDESLYNVVNGAITVSANYGLENPKNLYTKKQYRDFIFRFEFCFTQPAANNGVGIRTPRDVDAAYDGMCEIQILDHDDPVYEGLQPYQVHGSVYGVIPAKRIVHKPLGEWGTEEIIVKGDCITVTLNGEVVLDNVNVREACQGHNVAPDGGRYNPYTMDHRNHPGMFNEKGYVGFLGHGPGIRLKNVRILDLSK